MHFVYTKRVVSMLLVCFLLISCGGEGPQRPSQRSGQVKAEDSAAIALMEFNQRLAAAADDAVLRYVSERDDGKRFAQLPFSNAWERILCRGDEANGSPQKEELWTLHIQTYSLEGTLLLDSEQEYRIGRNELPMCVEFVINEWYHGTKVLMVSPWYAAYGMTGTSDIGAYENVLFEITVR